MTIRQKTVTYTFPTLAATLSGAGVTTNLTQITIWLPESSLSFVSVIARFSCDDISTAQYTAISTKSFGLRLGAAAYTTISNANVLTYSGESMSPFWIADFTSHFTANWATQSSAGSATCDFQVALNQTGGGTTPGFVNTGVILDITYNYDDTSATHIKTVLIPLTSPPGAIATAATTYDTIPALDTYLAESGKVYRNISVIVQGNEARNGATTDHTMTLRVGATSVTTGNYEGTFASDRFFRYIWTLKYAAVNNWPSTSATQTWQPTATVARVNHFQAYIIVTYEFTVSSTTTATNSVLLPMEIDGPIYGSGTAPQIQRAARFFYIEEPDPIAFSRVGYYMFWDQAAALAALSARIAVGNTTTNAATIAYTDTASVLCGSNAASITTTSFTLSRGKNIVSCDIWTTDLIDNAPSISGFWIINYTSGIADTGIGSHNNTRYKVLDDGFGTAAVATASKITVSTATYIPETSYYINGIGNELLHYISSVNGHCAIWTKVERLASENGPGWETAFIAGVQTDAEAGARYYYSQTKEFMQTWPGDIRSEQAFPRIDPTIPRRWWTFSSAALANSPLFFAGFTLIYTIHGIVFPVAGTISGSSGGTVTIDLVRAHNEVVKSTTRVGDGAFSFDWYDNTETVQVIAYESDTNKGQSVIQLAGALNTFDVNLGSTYYAYV